MVGVILLYFPIVIWLVTLITIMLIHKYMYFCGVFVFGLLHVHVAIAYSGGRFSFTLYMIAFMKIRILA